MSKKILITGATGFVGSRLAARLVQQQYAVHITHRASSQFWRLQDIQEGLLLHQIDLHDQNAIDALITTLKPNYIFHLACYGGFAQETDALMTFNTNMMATYYLLNAAANAKVERFMYVGSSSEYGLKETAMSEEDVERPQSLYGVTKLAGSLQARLFAEQKRLATTVLRIFSPYGPFDDSRRLIPMVIQACLNKTELALGSGSQVRDYIYIDDLLDAFLLAMNKAPGKGEIINLGSGMQRSVREVVNTIIKLCDHAITPHWHALKDKEDEPKSWVANINKAKLLLNWQPQTDLSAGLQKTISALKKKQ